MLSWALRRIVIDTNVLNGALLKRAGQNRQVIRACLEGKWSPLIGQALFMEYEDVLGRRELFRSCPLSQHDTELRFHALAAKGSAARGLALLAKLDQKLPRR